MTIHTTHEPDGLLVAYTPTCCGRCLYMNDARRYRRLPKVRYRLTPLGLAAAEFGL